MKVLPLEERQAMIRSRIEESLKFWGLTYTIEQSIQLAHAEVMCLGLEAIYQTIEMESDKDENG